MYHTMIVCIAAAVSSLGGTAHALSLVSTTSAMRDISTAPLVRVGDGWDGGHMYDLRLEVRPDGASRPMRLLFPTAEHALDRATSNPLPSSAGLTTASIWVSYDKLHSRRYPVLSVMEEPMSPLDATTRAKGMPHAFQWSDYVDIGPDRTTRFRLRFSLPPMDLDRRLLPTNAPETFTLTVNRLDLGCTVPVTVRRAFRLYGRDVLMKYGPRSR